MNASSKDLGQKYHWRGGSFQSRKCVSLNYTVKGQIEEMLDIGDQVILAVKESKFGFSIQLEKLAYNETNNALLQVYVGYR